MANSSETFFNATDESPPWPAAFQLDTKRTILATVTGILFVIALVGNGVMLCVLVRNVTQPASSRVHLLLLHMNLAGVCYYLPSSPHRSAFADLSSTLLSTPKEIGHMITVAWLAGNTACKLFKFFDVFGIYLSANVLIVLNIDSALAALKPAYLRNVKQ